MNPVVRQILHNIGGLSREPPQRTTGDERTVPVEGEVSHIFSGSSVQPSPSIYTSNASFTSTVTNVSTTSTSTAAQQGPRSTTNSALTPRFRLSCSFNSSRAGQNTRKKGARDKPPNGPFFKDVILLGGSDHENVPRQGARLWLMGNGHACCCRCMLRL